MVDTAESHKSECLDPNRGKDKAVYQTLTLLQFQEESEVTIRVVDTAESHKSECLDPNRGKDKAVYQTLTLL
ncbi:hypothetical protein VS893_24740, partial [Shigella flexneri]|nr:hypothetical protein [Shigella flexneri]